MSTNRHQVQSLDNLVPPPPTATSQSSSGTGAASAVASQQTGIHLLLHGFFFLEFQKNSLVIASPSFGDHKFLSRDQGSRQLNPVQGVIDLTSQLQAGTQNQFSTQILRFSRSGIGLARQFLIDITTVPKCGCVLILPLPKQIIELRRGFFSDFLSAEGKVAASIKKLAAVHVGLITCLEYDVLSGPAFTRSYYAGHCHKPNLADVNMALQAATTTFGQEFDLAITRFTNKTISVDSPTHLPPGVTQDDEQELPALVPAGTCPGMSAIPGGGVVEVTNCPQFCVEP